MDWLIDPSLKYGGALAKVQPASSDESTLHQVAPMPTHGLGGSLSPSEPLFWVGVIFATTLGCMAYSTLHKIG
jgi:hypothetical protein